MKYFLALDFPINEIIPRGLYALEFLEGLFGTKFMRNVGVKLNAYSLKRNFGEYNIFKEIGFDIFADEKIFHGADTGYRIIDELKAELDVDYVSVAALLGQKILREYVEKARKQNVKIISFTIHTKIPEKDAEEMHNRKGFGNDLCSG